MNLICKPDIGDKVKSLRKILGITNADLIVMHVGAMVLKGLTSSCGHLLIGIPGTTFNDLEAPDWIDTQGRRIIELAGILLTPIEDVNVLLRGEWSKSGEDHILGLGTDDLKKELKNSPYRADMIYHDMITDIVEEF